jgi:hypothetical protein
VADKSSQLLLAALTRAAAEAAGVPLHGNKAAPGLFPTTAPGKQAAQRSLDEGYLRAVGADRAATPDAGRTRTLTAPLCTITDKGLDHLLSQVSPRQVLEDFVRVLESREKQVGQLIALARQMQTSLEQLRAAIAPVLEEVARKSVLPAPADRLGNGTGDLKGLFHEFRQDKPADDRELDDFLLEQLGRWSSSGASEDCPLPELFRQAQSKEPDLTIGRFHDKLRALQDQGRIYLHPWTGPLYDIPEPPNALLTGHEVAYYASLRKED